MSGCAPIRLRLTSGATRLHFVSVFVRLRRDLPSLDYGTAGELAWHPSLPRLRRDESNNSCTGHRTRGHCALSAMLTVSQLSKSFAGRALFDDVSLQVKHRISSAGSRLLTHFRYFSGIGF